MNKEQIIKKVAISLLEDTEKLNGSYGTVSTTLTVHEGKVVSVCREIKETIRKREEIKE